MAYSARFSFFTFRSYRTFALICGVWAMAAFSSLSLSYAQEGGLDLPVIGPPSQTPLFDETSPLPPVEAPKEETSSQRDLGPDDFVVPDFLQEDQNFLGLGEDQGQFSLEKSQEELEESIRTRAFEAALQSLLPLRPEEIRTLLEKFDRTQESVELPAYPAPKPKMVVENISLDPGAQPAAIKLAFGHVSTVSILDMTGAPWPIDDISWAGDFEITETSTEEGSHILRISPGSQYASGNMSMRLLGLNTPVILSLETNRDLVHYRFDGVIPEFGPFAEAPLIQSGTSIQAGGQALSAVLQGVPPNGAQRLNVGGVDGRTSAYTIGTTTYIRTPLTLLSPSWSNSASSADGMRVYTVQNTPVLLLSDKGKMVRARLSEREDLFDE